MADLHPTDAAEVAAIVAQGRPIEILGRGSKRVIGRAVPADTRLYLDRLGGILLYEPDEMVISAHAGTPLSTIERALAAERQRLAFAPPDWRGLLESASDDQTIGGVIACNLSGSSRLSAGAARDHLIGFVAVNGRGETFKSGGRVVKNVTGYDLSKLMAGSFGTLAVLTQVTLRAMPMADYEATLTVRGLDAAAATKLFSQVLGGPFSIVSAAWLPCELAPSVGLEGDVALLRLEGLEISVKERCAALAQTHRVEVTPLEGESSHSLWKALGDGVPLARDSQAALWRISMPPSVGANFVAALSQARGWLDWGGGLCWLAVADEGDACAASIRALLAESGGHATLIRASESTRARVPVFEPLTPALAALTTRIKAEFDPLGILNPRRMG